MKISASIYSSKNMTLLDTIKLLDSIGVDYFHIDCNDDMSVFSDVTKIKKISKTPIDLHIISNKPKEFINKALELGVEQVSIQYEPIKDLNIKIPKSNTTRFGLAITSETPISVFDLYENLSFVLLMCTTPGKSGGKFDESNFNKINQFKEKYSNKIIEIDGGVNSTNSHILKKMGVHCVVSGSYLMSSNNLLNAMYSLKNNNSSYVMSDFMLKLGEIPIVSMNDLTLNKILGTIKEYKMGFCVITNNNNIIYGVVCDGDVREWLLKKVKKSENNLDDYYSMINKNPFTITENSNILNLLESMNMDNRTINFIPVTNNQKKLVGVVSFNNIIKGQL